MSPTVPHLVESASSTTRDAARTNARLVAASPMFGVLSPSTDMPWQPRKATSKCSERSTRSATGPTRASLGVRTPPVSTTSCASPSASAMRTELVVTVRRGVPARCCASSQVVVPAPRATDCPGCTRLAAHSAMACFSASSRSDFTSKPGSSLEKRGTVAPPWTFWIRPSWPSRSRSRRTVMSDTPSNDVSSETRTPPTRRTSSRMR